MLCTLSKGKKSNIQTRTKLPQIAMFWHTKGMGTEAYFQTRQNYNVTSTEQAIPSVEIETLCTRFSADISVTSHLSI